MKKLYKLFIRATKNEDTLAMRVFNQECQAYYIETKRTK